MFSQAGVKLIYLPRSHMIWVKKPFSELKAFIRRHWQVYEDSPDWGFDFFK